MFLLKPGVSVKFMQCKNGKFIEFIPFLDACDKILAALVLPINETLKCTQSEPRIWNENRKRKEDIKIFSGSEFQLKDNNYSKEEFEVLYRICKETVANYPYVQCVNKFCNNQQISLFEGQFKIAAIFTLTLSYILNKSKAIEIESLLEVHEAQRKIETESHLRMLLPGAIRNNIFHTFKYDSDPLLENLSNSEQQTLQFILEFFQLERRIKVGNQKFAEQMWDQLCEEERRLQINADDKLHLFPYWIQLFFYFMFNFAGAAVTLFYDKLQSLTIVFEHCLNMFGYFKLSCPVLRISGGIAAPSGSESEEEGISDGPISKTFYSKNSSNCNDNSNTSNKQHEILLATKVVVGQLSQVIAVEFSKIRETCAREIEMIKEKFTQKLDFVHKHVST